MHHQELATLGRIVAEATHDLNNVLAITRDAGGLLRDILSIAETDALAHRDKLERVADGIDRQTKRGTATAKALNRLAHLGDRERDELDLTDMTLLAIELTRRHANSFQVTVTTARTARNLKLEGPPLRTLLLLAACLRGCIEACAGKEVRVSTAQTGKEAGVLFASREGNDMPSPQVPDQALEATGAHLATDKNGVALRFASATSKKSRRLGLW